MKWSNVLMVFFSILWGFSSQGMMESLSESRMFPSDDPFQSGQSGLQTSSIEEAFQELTKRSFLDFYEGINRYIQYSANRDEEAQRELGDAQNALRLSIDYKPLLEAPVFKSFLDSSNLREIDKVKRALNGSYFGKHPQDLCKAIPYFLRNIDKNNEETINDANRVLDKLAQGSRANVADINIVKQKIAEVTKTSPHLNDQNIKECVLLLKEMCNFFPKKNFQKISHDLSDVQLFSLLNYKTVPSFQQTIIEPILNNIEAMISFISTQKVAEENKRISDLKEIKRTIENISKGNEDFSFEQINQWIRKVEDIAEVTLNPSEFETSTIQLAGLEEKRKKEEEAQQLLIKEQEQADIESFRNDPNIKNLIENPQKLLDYMSQNNWDKSMKALSLQMLFWRAYQDKNDVLEKKIRKTLEIINAATPRIVDHRGIKYPIFTYYYDEDILSQEAAEKFKKERKKLHSWEFFLEQFNKLPENAPVALKNLFVQTKKEVIEAREVSPHLAIKNYSQDIENQKKYLKELEFKLAEAVQEVKIAKERGGIQETTFGTQYESVEKSPEEIERELREEFEHEERYPQQKLMIEPFFHKTEFTSDELAKMKRKAQITPKELEKFVEKRQKFVAKREEEKKPIGEKFFSTEGEQRIRKKIESSIAREQEEMEVLIEKQVALLAKKISENPSAATLADIKKELEEYKTYVSPGNKKLLGVIQKNIDSLTTGKFAKSIPAKSIPAFVFLRHISQFRKLLTDLNKEPKELIEKIKETIDANIVETIKKAYMENGSNYLLNVDRYKNFPDDASLASLFQLMEFIEQSGLQGKDDISKKLKAIITESIDPEKIESKKSEIETIIKDVHSALNAMRLAQEAEAARLKEIEAAKKRAEEQARLAQEAEATRLAEQARLAVLAEAAEHKRQEGKRKAETAAAAEEQRKHKEEERQQAVANRLVAQYQKLQEQAAQLPPEQQKQLEEEILPVMLEAVDPNIRKIFAPTGIGQPAPTAPASIAGPTGEPVVSIEEPKPTPPGFFQAYSPVRRFFQGIRNTFNNAWSWLTGLWYGR